MDKCPKQNQGYKDTHLSEKKGHVSDSRIRGTCSPLEKKRETEKKKKKKKKMIAHGPSNKQYAIRDDKLLKKVKSLDAGV